MLEINHLTKRYVEKPVRQKSPFAALVGKELAKFLSSPNYMLNCGLGIVFMLIVGVWALLFNVAAAWLLHLLDTEGSRTFATL